MKDYKDKLKNKLKVAISDCLMSEGKLDVGGTPLEIALDIPFKFNDFIKIDYEFTCKDCSGDEIEINVDGSMYLHKKNGDKRNSKGIDFWIRPAIIVYNKKTDEFDVKNIDGFKAIGFSRL